MHQTCYIGLKKIRAKTEILYFDVYIVIEGVEASAMHGE